MSDSRQYLLKAESPVHSDTYQEFVAKKEKEVKKGPRFTFAMMKKSLEIFQVMHTYLDESIMINLYGYVLGNHLWNKRLEYQYTPLYHDEEKFFESMDEENQRKMFYWACTFFD